MATPYPTPPLLSAYIPQHSNKKTRLDQNLVLPPFFAFLVCFILLGGSCVPSLLPRGPGHLAPNVGHPGDPRRERLPEKPWPGTPPESPRGPASEDSALDRHGPTRRETDRSKVGRRFFKQDFRTFHPFLLDCYYWLSWSILSCPLISTHLPIWGRVKGTHLRL